MVSHPYVPDRGNILWLSFDPTRGHEQSGWRPAFVISPRSYNARTQMALVCPITAQVKGYPFEVLVDVGEIHGAILVDQVRAIDWSARRAHFVSSGSSDVIAEVQEKLFSLIE